MKFFLNRTKNNLLHKWIMASPVMVENMKVLNFKYIHEAAFWECIPYGNYKGGCIDLFKYIQVSLKLLAHAIKCIFKSNKMLFLCRTFCPFLFILHVLSLPLSFLSSYSQWVLFCQIHTSYYLFIYSSTKYLLSACSVPGNWLDAGDTGINKKTRALLVGIYILVIGSSLEWNSDKLW